MRYRQYNVITVDYNDLLTHSNVTHWSNANLHTKNIFRKLKSSRIVTFTTVCIYIKHFVELVFYYGNAVIIFLVNNDRRLQT